MARSPRPRGERPHCTRRTLDEPVRARMSRLAARRQLETARLTDSRRMRLDHGSLLVSDVERSVRFYTGALGLTEVPRPPTFDAPARGCRSARPADPPGRRGGAGRTREMNPPWDPAEIAIGYSEPPGAPRRRSRRGARAGRVARRRARRRGLRARRRRAATFVTDPDGHVIELMETGVPVTGLGAEAAVPRRSGRGTGPRGWKPGCVTDLLTDVRAEPRDLWPRRALMGVFTAVAALALWGFIGQQDSRSVAEANGVRMVLEAPEAVRGGLYFQSTVEITTRGGDRVPAAGAGRGLVRGHAGELDRAGRRERGRPRWPRRADLRRRSSAATGSRSGSSSRSTRRARSRRSYDIELDDETRPLVRIDRELTVLP